MSARPRLVQGNAACAAGAIAAGCRFYAGYPITPSSEIAEEMARRLPAVGGVFVQMEDEIASLAAVLGASLGGVPAMTATSGPGFSLMQEHLGFAAMAEIPCVVVDVMRGGPSTGLPTSPAQGDVMQARWGMHGDAASVVLAPGSVTEVYELTADAFALAERFRTPVVVLYDEVIGHLREEAILRPLPPERAPQRRRPQGPPDAYRPYAPDPDGVPPLADFGSGYRFHVTGLAHDDRGFPTQDPAVIDAHQRRRIRKLAAAAEAVAPVEVYRADEARVLFVGYGITGRAACEAADLARAAGLPAGALRLRLLWPFPVQAVRAAMATCDLVVVAELNLGQIVHEVERAAAGRIPVVPCCRVDGQPLAPEEILAAADAAMPVGRLA